MSDAVVYTWSEVLINGKSQGVHPVSIKASISGDLPGRLSFGSGITQRTGEIRWDRVIGKDGLMVSPYRRDGGGGFTLPSPNDRVEVRMGVQPTDPRVSGLSGGRKVFTGKVDYSDVSSNGYPTTYIVDDIDKLNRIVRLPPITLRMPPQPGGQYSWFRHGNITPETTLSWLARKCGFHATPLAPGTVYLQAQLQGSFHIEPDTNWGSLAGAYKNRDEMNALPMFRTTAMGLALMYGIGEYMPGSTLAPQRLLVSMYVGKEHSADSYVQMRFNNDQTHIYVFVSAGKVVSVQYGGVTYTGPTLAGNEYVSVAIKPDGSIVFKTAAGEQIAQGAAWTTGAAGTISVVASDGAALAALNISGTGATETNHPAVTFVPSAKIKCGDPFPIFISRSVRDEKAINVIEEICDATSCVCYLDGDGKLNILYGEYAHVNQLPLGPLTTRKQIKKLTVREDSQLASHDVIVKYKTTDVIYAQPNGQLAVDLWMGPDEQFEAQETKIYWPAPGSDEEWIDVDTTLEYPFTSQTNLESFWHKQGSFAGFSAKVGEPGAATEHWVGGYIKMEQVVPWQWKLTVAPNEASSTHVPEVKDVPPNMWGKPSMQVRGGAKVTILPAEPVKATGGSTLAADLTHDAETWSTEPRSIEIAQYAMKMSRKALPVIKNLECFFDERIEVNTRWTLDLTESVGVKLDCYVLEVDHDPANDTSSLTVRVLSDLTAWVWASLPENYRTFQAVQDDFTTYAALETGK